MVLTGSKHEIERCEALASIIKAPTLNLAGRTSLGTLAAFLNDSRLLVCNDTGVSHLAAALRVPSVVISDESTKIELAKHLLSPLDQEPDLLETLNTFF